MQPDYKGIINEYKIQKDARKATSWLNESFKDGTFKPKDFDFGKLFSECYGHDRFRDCRDSGDLAWNVMEAGGATGTSSFLHISGAILLSAIRTAYEDEAFVMSAIIPDEPSKIIGPERVGDVTPIGAEALVVPEGKAFGYGSVSEDYFQLPEAKKRGFIVALTREAVFQDQTGKLLSEAANVGNSLGIDKELRLIDCVVDENDGAVSAPTGHRYCRMNTYTATYGDNSGSHNWDNLQDSNALQDWTDLDAAELLLNNMVHPVTGLPIVCNSMHLVCTKQLERTAKRILSATELRYTVSGAPTETLSPNPMNNATLVTSRYLATRMATDTSWYWGDLSKAFGYKVIFPFQTIAAPANSHDEFTRDIIKQWRADEMGAAFTREPRAIVKSTVA